MLLNGFVDKRTALLNQQKRTQDIIDSDKRHETDEDHSQTDGNDDGPNLDDEHLPLWPFGHAVRSLSVHHMASECAEGENERRV
eukprot:m.125383 g.125383  ORF g.125383 m.125383 type:complete len:84 (-) comp23461_c0_seq2:29-280(-)